MDMVAPPSLRASTFCFQPRQGAFALTVVVKMTFVLAPGTCTAAPEPEELLEEENYWDDDPRRSLYAPSDVAPLKRRADVILVGSAFAPGGRAVRSLVARLVIGEVDKAIEVHGPRVFTSSGDLREGAGWAKMPLRYERAAGGPETWNPVGVWLDGPRDPYGQRHLPNLQPVGLELREPGQLVPPTGFGPIPTAWPSRRQRLRARGEIGGLRDARRSPLGDDFDLAYFQDAPLDQQLAVLRADQPFLLENLHPEHDRLSTRLPDLVPRAGLELAGEEPRELTLVPDTLWIDTDRARCTLTFRGHVPVAGPELKGRVRVTLDEPEVRSPGPGPVRLGAPLRGERALTLGGEATTAKEDITGDMPAGVMKEITAIQQPSQAPAPLPFAAAPRGSAPARTRPATSPGSAPPRPRGERQMTEEIVLPPEAMSELAGPSWLAQGASPGAPANPGAPPRPPLSSSSLVEPPLPLEMLMRRPAVAPPSLAGASSSALHGPPPIPSVPGTTVGMASVSASPGTTVGMASVSASPGTFAPVSSSPTFGPSPLDAGAPAPPPPDVAKLGESDVRGLGGGAAGGLLAASNAAAGNAAKPAPRREGNAESSSDTRGEAGGYLELLWFDKAIVPRLRSHHVFGSWMKPPPKAGPTQQGKPPPPPPTPEAIEKAERADIHHILGKDPAAAAEANKPPAGEEEADPPLVLAAGTLSFPFEEVEALKIVLAVAKPLAASDKKLKELCDLGAELLGSDLEADEAAPHLGAKIREAWGRANRTQPANHLDTRVEQKLLEQRHYQKRSLLDGEWLRALLTTPGGESFVAYVPVALKSRLPLFARFPVKLLAELYPQQDPAEISQVALKVAGLARVAARPRLGKG